MVIISLLQLFSCVINLRWLIFKYKMKQIYDICAPIFAYYIENNHRWTSLSERKMPSSSINNRLIVGVPKIYGNIQLSLPTDQLC